MKVLIFCKEKPGLRNALSYLKLYTKDITVYKGSRKDKFPKEALKIKSDLTISYISPWIMPEKILKDTKKWAINFHPGPPEYPGIGCTNFAIYNEEKEYGITAHIMEPKVDTGRIINVVRFPILPKDTVYSLTQRCYDYLLIQFYKVIDYVFYNNKLPDSDEKWKRKPYTRKDLNKLCEIKPNMSKEEIKKRIKATTYPNMPGAYIEISGEKFIYNPLYK